MASNMIVGITGSREFPSPVLVGAFILSVAARDPNVIICQGRARGVDSWARKAAVEANLWVIDVPVEGPHWDFHGKVAGHKRNAIIASISDRVVAFWDGKSRGTRDCIRTALILERPVRIIMGDGSVVEDLDRIKELVE